MKKITAITLSFLLLTSFSLVHLNAMEYTTANPENTVFAFDLDDVISETKIVDQPTDVLKLASVAYILAVHPTLLWNMQEIIAKGKEICKGNAQEGILPTNGTSNIVHNLMLWLENEKGYQGMCDYTPWLTETFVNPVPKQETINLIQQLKECGHTVIFATNQDTIQHRAYREKMLAKGYDVEELFDGGISTTGYNLQNCLEKDSQPISALSDADESETWHITTANKPKKRYYRALKKLADFVKPECDIIFIDDKEANIEQATEQGITGIHFTSAEQLKTELQKRGFGLE